MRCARKRRYTSTKSWRQSTKNGAKGTFDKWKGWGQEPWSQGKKCLPDNVAKRAAQISDVALVYIIGRTAGRIRIPRLNREATCLRKKRRP